MKQRERNDTAAEEILLKICGTHNIPIRPRLVVARVLFLVCALYFIALPIMVLKNDARIVLMSILVALTALVGISTMIGVRKIQKIKIDTSGIYICPIGIGIPRSNIELVHITETRTGRSMITVYVRKGEFHFYPGSLVWLGKKVSFHL